MQSYFLPLQIFKHNYRIKCWNQFSNGEKDEIISFDGTKLRVFDCLTAKILSEVDFFDRSGNSSILSITINDSISNIFFLVIKEQKNFAAYDSFLKPVPSLGFKFNFNVLSSYFVQNKNILLVTGNFGQRQALTLKKSNSPNGLTFKWDVLWTKHDTSQWMTNIDYDELSDSFFASSGVEVFNWCAYNGNLNFKFETKHTMSITSLKYSSNLLTLFTVASDGQIILWKLMNGQPKEFKTIKQAKVGKIIIDIDDENSLYTFSSDRIIRRYNCRNCTLIASIDLQHSVSLNMKDMESTLKMEYNKKSFKVYISADKVISEYKIYSAPKEFTNLCQPITMLYNDSKGYKDLKERFIAISSDNIVHIFSNSGKEVKTVDLDSGFIPSKVKSIYLEKEFLICGLTDGIIRIINLENNSTNKIETNSSVLSIFISNQFLVSRHTYCPCQQNNTLDDKVVRLLFSSSKYGEIFVHCLDCRKFIIKFKFSPYKLKQIKPVQNSNIIVGINKNSIFFWEVRKADIVVKKSILLNIPISKMEILDNKYVIVASKNGSLLCFDIHSMTELHHIRVHNSCINSICFCYHDEICSFADDSTFYITNIVDGVSHKQQTLPFFKQYHCSTSLQNNKLVISIDNSLYFIDCPHVGPGRENDNTTKDISNSDEEKLKEDEITKTEDDKILSNDNTRDTDETLLNSSNDSISRNNVIHSTHKCDNEISKQILQPKNVNEFIDAKSTNDFETDDITYQKDKSEIISQNNYLFQKKTETVDLLIIDGKPKLLFSNFNEKNTDNSTNIFNQKPRPKSSLCNFPTNQKEKNRDSKEYQFRDSPNQFLTKENSKSFTYNAKLLNDKLKKKDISFSQEELTGSFFSLDVKPIMKPKRISRTPLSNRKNKNFHFTNNFANLSFIPHEIVPIQKINTQPVHYTAPTSPNARQQVIQSPKSTEKVKTINPLTITQIDTPGFEKKKNNKNPIISTRKNMIHQVKGQQKLAKSKSSISKTTKKVSFHGLSNNNDNKTNNNQPLTNKENNSFNVVPQIESIPFSDIIQEIAPTKKDFQEKDLIENIGDPEPNINYRGNIAFSNGKIISSIHFQKEPNKYVIACCIHPDFEFNFFTFTTNPLQENIFLIDEDSYDIFNLNYEYSKRLNNNSKFIYNQFQLFGKPNKPLYTFMIKTPSLTRHEINEKKCFRKINGIRISNTKQNNEPSTTDSLYPGVDSYLEILTIPAISDEINSIKQDDKFDFKISSSLRDTPYLSEVIQYQDI